MLKILSFLIPHRDKRTWLYILKEDFSYSPKSFKFRCLFENEWLIINPLTNTITVKKGYAWDGCTPKYNIFDLFVLGVPEGRLNIATGRPYTYVSSLFHDVLCQFKTEIGHNIRTQDVHHLFEEQLGDFDLKRLYLWAIVRFGPHK